MQIDQHKKLRSALAFRKSAAVCLVVTFLSFCAGVLVHAAEEGVCARVRLRMSQDAIIARNAFKATLEISNSPENVRLENLRVSLDIRGRDNLSANNLFGIQPPELSGVNDVNGGGIVQPGVTASVTWLIVPTREAASDQPTQYFVGGDFRYTENGGTVAMSLFPAPILVEPDPLLVLDYFWVRDVYSDDPFTPEIEPAEPFPLGLMVRNNGKGIANNFRITSLQPQIVENEKGLLIDFKIIGTQVNSEAVSPSLTVNLGNIDPGTTSVAKWMMTSSLQGKFIEYKATFEHVDGLGNPRLSLIDTVNIHELTHAVRVDTPTDDNKPDFLVNDIPDEDHLPDTLYNSTGPIEAVSIGLNPSVNWQMVAGQMEAHLTATVPTGWIYIRTADPGQERFLLKRVVRSDGREILLDDNVWTTHRTIRLVGQAPYREHLLHLFDGNSTGSYTLIYETTDTTPPTGSIAVNNGATYTNSVAVNLSISASDENSLSQMCISNSPSCSSWESYATSKSWTLTPGDGGKTVYVWLKDGVGNANVTPYSGSIILDTIAPTGSIVINGGSTYTNATSVTLTLSASDTGSGISQMRFSSGGTSWSAWGAYGSSKDWSLDSGDGTKMVYVQFKDNANNASGSFSSTIVLDTQGPSGSVVINGGATFTNSPNVTLALSAADGAGVSEMRFSNDNSAWAAWGSYNTVKSWSLNPGDGIKTVYAKFKDTLGNVSGSYSNTITLDATPPVSGTISINNGAATTQSLIVTLNTLGGTDLSGISEMRFSNNSGGPWSSAEAYAPVKSNWNLSQYGGNSSPGSKAVFVQYKDVAGNWSSSFWAAIHYQPLQLFPFTDDFSTDKGWFRYEAGGWERRPAVAGGGENGNPDPGTDHSLTGDNYVFGYAIGADYPNDLTTEESIISPPVDCTGQSTVFLKFWRYVNVENNHYDHAKVYISNDNTNWAQVWENHVFDLTDNQWTQVVFDISTVAANQETVYIRFTMGPTNSSRRFSGWNIDDLEVTSDYSGPLALYVPAADSPNPNIDEILIENGLGIRHFNEIPSDLSDYTLLIVSKDEACNSSTANYIKNFVENGGGAIIIGGTPKLFAGNADDLSSIKDWFGAGSYGNDCDYGMVEMDHPFWTTLLTNDKVDYLSTSPCLGDSVSNLDSDATLISKWSNGSKVHSFKHFFGSGRIFYYAGDPGYSEDPNRVIVENGLTLFEAGLLWASNLLPEIFISPPSKDFGSVTVGSTSSAQTFTVTNTSRVDLIIGALSITGADASQFGRLNDMCSGNTMTHSSNCTVDVVFSPTSAGSKNASLSISSNASNIPTVNVPLAGTGTKKTYTVTASVGGDAAGGSVTPPSQIVNDGDTATFTVTTNVGYTASVVEGTLTGSTWTIANITSSRTVTVTFTKVSPIQLIQNLIGDVRSWNLPKGTEQSLTSKLDAANKSLEKGQKNAAINQINAFINEVNAQRGKKLTDAQADDLIKKAKYIIDVINL